MTHPTTHPDGSISRRYTRRITVGGRGGRSEIVIGYNAPISIQSMIKRDPSDVNGIIADCLRLEDAGCDIIRITIPDETIASTLKKILSLVTVPIVADIHFSSRAALASIEAGVDKIRLNPGNLSRPSDIQAIAKEAKDAGIPIRVGVNSGSLPKDLLEKYQGERVPASVEGALRHVEILHDAGFFDIVVAIKSSHTDEMIHANRLFAAKSDCPIHIGVTEAGCAWEGNIRSAIGIGTLLSEGIGDTIRVSLTDDPVEEVKSGLEILRSLNLRECGVTFISCPTCGRLEADIRPVAKALRERVGHLKKPLRVAVMGCAVNGPGEAAGSDLCLLAGKEIGIIYRGASLLRTVPIEDFIDEMEKEILALYLELYGKIE
jgi:(E)-4-hydroxy-3-methylbut-2-enyl-diphosphate synthase